MNDQTTVTFDEAKAERFGEQMVDTLNSAALALMTSIGHRTNLFDALAGLPNATSKTLAEKAGLAERYIREWLAVMVTSGVVDYDPGAGTYNLPPEHAALLTRAAEPDNMAVTCQFIGVMASVEEDMVARFRDGAGTHYHDYCRFHEVMAEDSAQLVVSALIEHILPVEPGLIERLEHGIDVLDVGCGAGRAMMELAQAFPASRFMGIDLCEDAFTETQVSAARMGLKNLTFRAQDLSKVKSLGRFDLITAFDAVHDQKDPQGLLDLVYRSLAEDGLLLMQDIGGSRNLETNIQNPFAPLLYSLSLMHCTPVSIGQGGPGLGAMWGIETAQEYLANAGFGQVETHHLPHDQLNAYFFARR
ncbi:MULTISPECIES: class I SAM-dependent methyltransferase [unclassified Ruegeria]|uniref:class I SAM-dependent methyltransferase n=1 Tax=unclassified Ruegeria TaxID=2625375 RepID=UPI001490A35E|nr:MULTISPECIES: class I SAM-dependent methyltransferase [unclassified Ruegeria]NOD78854.1 methyltransferase domain-containing protein [Ruegeria sp. HKCCD4332]UUV08493.1 class I SAM-dependent methyltransferase [Ruegeria sp. YS9]